MSETTNKFVTFGGILIALLILLVSSLERLGLNKMDILSLYTILSILLIFWFVKTRKLLKKSSKGYIKDKKTGFMIGRSYKEVARGLDNNKLKCSINRTKNFLEKAPIILLITLVIAIYGYYMKYEEVKNLGIFLSGVIVVIYISLKRILSLYEKEKNRRKL